MWVHGLTKYGDVKWNSAVAVILTNSCLNPFIYSMRYKEFQKNTKALMRRIAVTNTVVTIDKTPTISIVYSKVSSQDRQQEVEVDISTTSSGC